jgi:hypothetical protein
MHPEPDSVAGISHSGFGSDTAVITSIGGPGFGKVNLIRVGPRNVGTIFLPAVEYSGSIRPADPGSVSHTVFVTIWFGFSGGINTDFQLGITAGYAKKERQDQPMLHEIQGMSCKSKNLTGKRGNYYNGGCLYAGMRVSTNDLRA